MIMTDAMKSALCDEFLVRWLEWHDRKARGVNVQAFRLGTFMAEMDEEQSEHLIFELAERLFIVTETLRAVQRMKEARNEDVDH